MRQTRWLCKITMILDFSNTLISCTDLEMSRHVLSLLPKLKQITPLSLHDFKFLPWYMGSSHYTSTFSTYCFALVPFSNMSKILALYHFLYYKFLALYHLKLLHRVSCIVVFCITPYFVGTFYVIPVATRLHSSRSEQKFLAHSTIYIY